MYLLQVVVTESGLMGHVFPLLEALGPVLAAVLTVPILNLIKRAVGFLDAGPAWVKQVLAVVVAYGINLLGSWLNVTLAPDLALWDAGTVEALLSGIGAWAIHAGKKAAQK